jgi:hypothetical protein
MHSLRGVLMEDTAYFQVLAGVSATLLALSFVALSFFLEGLFRRHKTLVLPVIRQEDVNKGSDGLQARLHSRLPRISNMTDLRLFDGDPLVVFVAFSVAVTWNLYFISLLASVTASVPEFSYPIVFAVELSIFGGTLVADLEVRHRQYKRLRTYRTRDEHMWRPYGLLLSVIYVGLALFAIMSAIPALAARWMELGFDSSYWLRQILKGACPFALFSALYFTNHDCFVFFKARVSDDVRQRWLGHFVTKEYPSLVDGVGKCTATLQGVPEVADRLAKLTERWNGGCPPEDCFTTSLGILNAGVPPWQKMRASLSNNGATPPPTTKPPGFSYEDVWEEVLANRGKIAGWMVDVPGISGWADGVSEGLRELA